MILINLLPPEHRTRRRTPVKLLAAVAVAATVNASLVAYWAWTAFGAAAEVSSELAVLEDTMASLDPQIRYHESLQEESKVFQAREETLSDVTSKRVSWTRRLDELVDVIHEGGTGSDKYLVWLDGVTVDTKENSRRSSYGSLSATGNSGSNVFAQVANFLDDLEASPLMVDFGPPAPPEGSVQGGDPDLVPSEVWTFPLEMNLREPAERAKRRKAEAQPPAAPAPASSDEPASDQEVAR